MTTARRRGLALGAALLVLAAAVGHAVLRPTPFHHQRSSAVLVLAGALAAALLVLAPRVPSLPLALGAGIAAGGALATLVTGALWSQGVPNPIVRGGVAFNLSDVAIAVGDALLIAAALAHAWAHRRRLREPV